jgi:uncharacterized protein YjbJ (UPF0337 family)
MGWSVDGSYNCRANPRTTHQGWSSLLATNVGRPRQGTGCNLADVVAPQPGLTEPLQNALPKATAPWRQILRGRSRLHNTEIRMNKNQIEGSVKDVAGKLQQRVGKVTGDTKQQVRGVAKQIEGKIQKGVGAVERALDKASRKAR